VASIRQASSLPDGYNVAGLVPAIFLPRQWILELPSVEKFSSNRQNEELDALQTLIREGNYLQAERDAKKYLLVQPNDRNGQYCLAVALRMQTKIADALQVLEELERWHPKFPRLHQERGHCHIFRRDAAAAIAAFESAVQLTPALPASWQALQTLYRMVGRLGDARTAGEHVRKLAELPPAIVTARAMMADGDMADAEGILRPYLLEHPSDVEGLRLLAGIAREYEYADKAETILAELLSAAPGYNAARYEYVLALLDQQKHAAALREIDVLLKREENQLPILITRASTLLMIGEIEAAIKEYRGILELVPDASEVRHALGHALKTAGDIAAAIESYRQAAKIRPSCGEVYWSLANLKTYGFSDAELEEMRRQVQVPELQTEDRYHFSFALGKALEDRGEYAESFAHYAAGNRVRKELGMYRPEAQDDSVHRQLDICTSEFFKQRQGWGSQSLGPIFVLGLPRAGSTLIEQILASHSQVEGTMELANIPRLVGALNSANPGVDAGYPNLLRTLTAEQCAQFGDEYLTDTVIYRVGKPFFIDKMPNNFRHIGLIHLMLPNAKIIDARRDPMDCCFSNFKQLYARGHPFAYDLADVGRYYRLYVELMDHWDQVLPSRVLRVQHEDVLADLEGSVRRLLDYCGLPFEEGCVEFHKNTRKVHTASSEQVRRPINRDGVGQWRPYESWLGPLKEALGPLAPQG
jgi:tetratricopeptide (TPR) repeat protein